MDIVVRQPFISISGLIGAGKTTLAKSLSKVMGLPVYEESINDDGYLTDFYKNIEKIPNPFAFPLQVHLFNQRQKQHNQIILSEDGAIQDRSIYEDTVFAKTLLDRKNMSPRDYKTYMTLINRQLSKMGKPDLIVHLDVSPEESLSRIKKRSRGVESGVTLDYLQHLHKNYELFLKNISKSIPVIRVDWSNFKSAEEVAAKIKLAWKNTHNIQLVTFTENSISTNNK